MNLPPTGRAQALWAAATQIGFVLVSVYWVVVATAGDLLANDARVYWAAGHAVVMGTDPWAAGNGPWHFGSFPPTALLFAPAGFLPEPVFLGLWMALTIASAVYIVRALGLAPWWMAYPPLVFGVVLGNPIVASMALVLAGRGVLGALLRPQNALVVLVRQPRTLAPLALVGVLSLLVFPQWLGEVGEVTSRYAAESGPPINAWGSLWVVPAAVLLLALALDDAELAAWLLPVAVLPAAGWYAAIAVMVTRRPNTALLAAIPVAGAAALACSAEAAVRVWASRARMRQ